MIYGVLGAGSWGTAMAHLLGQREEVYLWGRDESLLKRIQIDRVNDLYLSEVELPYEVRATYDLEHVVRDSDVLLLAVPSHAFRDLLARAEEQMGDVEAVICLTKGFDPETGQRLSQVYQQVRGELEDYYLLTGPSHAEEVAQKRPTSVVLGGGNQRQRTRLQEVFYRTYFRVYTNDDLVGLEMGGALKNIIAIASGISDGLGYGVNSRAALLTRGMHELRRLAVEEGAKPQTLYGLSGMGDLIVTATSTLSRNYQLGTRLARGESLQEARDAIGQIAEGVNATRVAYRKAAEAEVRAPIVKQVYRVLFEGTHPEDAVEELMTRRTRPEFEPEEW